MKATARTIIITTQRQCAWNLERCLSAWDVYNPRGSGRGNTHHTDELVQSASSLLELPRFADAALAVVEALVVVAGVVGVEEEVVVRVVADEVEIGVAPPLAQNPLNQFSIVVQSVSEHCGAQRFALEPLIGAR